jgi:transposase
MNIKDTKKRDDKIVAMKDKGATYREIAKEFNLSIGAVQGIICKYKNNGVTFIKKKEQEELKVKQILNFLYSEYGKLEDERNKVVLLCKFGDIYLELSKQVIKLDYRPS